jgi:hypothetical protein
MPVEQWRHDGASAYKLHDKPDSGYIGYHFIEAQKKLDLQ